jgi:hypothetical protein
METHNLGNSPFPTPRQLPGREVRNEIEFDEFEYTNPEKNKNHRHWYWFEPFGDS